MCHVYDAECSWLSDRTTVEDVSSDASVAITSARYGFCHSACRTTTSGHCLHYACTAYRRVTGHLPLTGAARH